MWAMLRHHNDYDQHGGYFVGIFRDFSLAYLAIPNGHIGRRNAENVWYTLFECKEGITYTEGEISSVDHTGKE